MMASIPAYEQYNVKLRSQMRKSLVDSLTGYENKSAYEDSIYQALVFNEYYKQHLCRLTDWPIIMACI
jgi:proline iminopeptidase